MEKVESLMSAEANTPEGDRLDVLVTLIEAYERKHSLLKQKTRKVHKTAA